MSNDIDLLSAHADKILRLAEARLSNEYYYQSLPLCVIDAVYSIGVRYAGVQRVVKNYCKYFELRKFREPRHVLPTREQQDPISAFCRRFEDLSLEAMTATVFRNRQRTSTRSGILKSDAVYRFACALRAHGVEYFQDVAGVSDSETLKLDIQTTPGQKTGISLQYFWMLAGSDEFIKPDRMVLRFLSASLKRSVSVTEAQTLLSKAASQLQANHAHLTPRLLDYVIWQYQRQQTPIRDKTKA